MNRQRKWLFILVLGAGVLTVFPFSVLPAPLVPPPSAGQRESPARDSVRIYLQNYQYKEALRVIQTMRPERDRGEWQVFQGMAYRGLLRYQQAIESFEEAIGEDSLNYTALVELAHILVQTGDYHQALTYLQRAERIRPAAVLRAEMAALWYGLEDYSRATRSFLSLLRDDPSQLLHLKNVAKCYEQTEQIDSAIFYYERVLLQVPSELFSTNRLCNLYLKIKDYDRGIDLSDRFRRADSTQAKINRMNAYLYYLKQDYAESLARFSRCFREGDTVLFTLRYLGNSYFMDQNYDSAKVYLEKAYLKDTADVQLCYYYGLTLARLPYSALGIQYIQKAIAMNTPDPALMSRMYHNLADAYVGSTGNALALKAYLKARDLNPKDTMLLFKLGQFADHTLRDTTMTLRFYKEFMDLCDGGRTGERPVSSAPEQGPAEPTYYSVARRRVGELENKP